MKIVRRLFVVLLANNNCGKSTIIRALVSQGLGRTFQVQRKGVRLLTSPWGRPVDAYIFGRSFQEVEQFDHGTVENALNANDPEWRSRELVIMPSHVTDKSAVNDIDEMIDAAHSAGFDAICATVIITGSNQHHRSQYRDIWRKPWDERWTIPNPYLDDPEGQLEALGRDLWTWICRALAP